MTRTLLMTAAITLLSIGCANTANTGPPDVDYGRDLCIECGMVIDDERFAASYRLLDGTEKRFDDLGGLIVHGRATGDLASATVWVHDFETRAWIHAKDAYFVPAMGVASPMGHGILAFTDEERAKHTAHDLDGEVLRWEAVRRLPIVNGLVGDHHVDEVSGGHEHETTNDDT